MKAKFSFFALSALMLASCSSSDILEAKSSEAITFTASTVNQSRYAESNSVAIASGIDLWGFTANGDNLFATGTKNATTLTKTGDAWGYGSTLYWPNQDVNFFGAYPVGVASVAEGATVPSIADYNCPGNVDVLYSANFNENKSKHTAGDAVAMQLKHALAQVVFQVKNTNTTGITVKVKGISLANIQSKGSFAWPASASAAGVWSNSSELKTYLVGEATSSVELTSTAATVGNSNLFLLPQTLKEWINGEGKVNADGANILVNCQVIDNASNLQIWPKTGETGNVAIAFPATTWEQGKKYIYTLAFGSGAGYEPDPTPGDKPTPVLVAISLSVDVEGFTAGETIDDLNTVK